ncbi:MAG: hypothetical protein WC861_01290 [Candidatus Micrarchaeia archaeon]|jgi:hypothetical protein
MAITYNFCGYEHGKPGRRARDAKEMRGLLISSARQFPEKFAKFVAEGEPIFVLNDTRFRRGAAIVPFIDTRDLKIRLNCNNVQCSRWKMNELLSSCLAEAPIELPDDLKMLAAGAKKEE